MSNPSRTLAPALAPAGSSLRYPDLQVVTTDRAVPPVARVVPATEVVHGRLRTDHYHWLRDRSNPEVLAYLEAENRHTAAVMRHTEELQERHFQEMRGRIRETELSVPERLDQYLYYTRTEAGGQYPILCRTEASGPSAEEILLDQNPLAEGHAYFRVGLMQVSPDHRYLAYTVDVSGAEEFTVFVKDLTTGEL